MDSQYLALAIQYYLAGRSASFAYSMPVVGNLFHHAVEMLLKYFLINSYSADQLKNEFGHNLKKLWDAFKKVVNDRTLDKFDGLISDLNDFEELRYPGKGFIINISIYKCKRAEASGETAKTKQYLICLEDIDEFVSALLTGRVTKGWIESLLVHGDALAQYKKDNNHPFF